MKKRNFRQQLWLLWFLTDRELKRKYKSATLGFLWMMVNPLIQMVVLTVVFSYFFRIKVENYPLFALSGLLPWTFFSQGMQAATDSLVGNRELIKKVPFPRELLPISSVLGHLYSFLLALLLLMVFSLIVSGISFGLILLLPVIALEATLIIALGLLFSSLDIYYRDVSFIVQAVVLVWFYLTPIIYPLEMVPEVYLSIYKLNPLVGIIVAFQAIFLRSKALVGDALMISVLETAIFLCLGVIVFKKRARYFADWI